MSDQSPIGQPPGTYMKFGSSEAFIATKRLSFDQDLDVLRENFARFKAVAPELYDALDAYSTALAAEIGRDLDHIPPAILSESVLRVLSGTAALIAMIGPAEYVNIVSMTAAKIGGHIK